jgi:protein O-mannosyl-transferase
MAKPGKNKRGKHKLKEVSPKLNLDRKTSGIVAIIFTVFAFAIYGNTIPFGYAFDDTLAISGNEFTKQGFDGLGEIFTNDFFTGFYGKDKNMVAGGRYRPLSLATFAVEYQLFGENPQINHFINILFYAISGFLLYLILTLMFRKRSKSNLLLSVPFIAGLIFIAHPLHTEVVANIKGRDEILALLFSLAALWNILNYARTNKNKHLIFASVNYFLALLSKENSITFLAIIPAALFFFYDKKFKELVKPMLPLLGSAIIFLLIRQSTMGESNETLIQDVMNNPFVEMSLAQKYATILFTLALYVKLLFVPHPLTFDYYPYHIPITDWIDLRAIISVLLFAGLLVLFIKSIKAKSPIAFSILYFIATISVASNLFFPVGVFMNERFAYMPSVAITIALALLFIEYLPRLFKNVKAIYIATPLLLITLLLFSFKTIDRNKAWESSLILFTTDVKTSQNSAKSNALAGEFLLIAAKELEKGELQTSYNADAIKYLSRAIEVYPKHGNALFNLAAAHYEYNRNYEAMLEVYKKVLKISPYEPRVFQNMNSIMNEVKDPDFKINAYNQLASLSPENAEIELRLGRIYLLEKKDALTSIPYLERSVELNPRVVEAQNSVGVAYYQSGRINDALNAFLSAEQLNPSDKQVVTNVMLLYQQLGNNTKVAEYSKKVEALNP